MNLFLSIDELNNLPWRESAVAVGTFDGVHRGHQAVIRRAIEDAQAYNRASVVFTFDRHPTEIVRSESSPPYLCTLQQRIQFIKELNVDNIVVLPFTKEFSQITADTFSIDILKERLKCSHLVVGEDFRFGLGGTGSVTYLQNNASQFGFEVTPVATVCEKSVRISSTRIREAIALGDLAIAEELLGRRFLYSGSVVKGHSLGRTMGFPTANLVPVTNLALPADGIYATTAELHGDVYAGACSIGMRPTRGGTERTVEVYLIDYDGADIYGATIDLTFIKRLRDQWKLSGLEQLKEQIEKDVDEVRDVLGGVI